MIRKALSMIAPCCLAYLHYEFVANIINVLGISLKTLCFVENFIF